METKIVIIIPVYNEESKIGMVLKRVLSTKFKNIVVVDDGSTDNSVKIIKKFPVKLIALKNNSGVGNAIKIALQYSISMDFEIVVIMAGDDQDDPIEISNLIEPIIDGKFDFVQGSRYLSNKHIIIPIKYIQTKIYSYFFSFISQKKITDASNGFRAFNLIKLKPIILKLLLKQSYEKYQFEPYLFLNIIKNGYKVKEVPVHKYYNVEKGYSKMVPFVSWFEITQPLIYELIRKILKN